MPFQKKAPTGWKAQAEKMKQDLLKRSEEAASRQKEGMSTRATYFIKDKVGKMPYFMPQEGEHIVDVVPFIAGRQDPRNPEGSYAYVVDFWAHFNVGANNEAIICPRLNFQKKCPICDYMRAQRLERSEWDKIRAKRRTVYLVWPHDESGKLEKAGVHIWDVSHFYFENNVTEIAKKPRGGGFVLFQSPDKDGKQIRFTITKGKYQDKVTGETGERREYKGFSFIDRDEDLPERIINHGIKLDELIHMKPSVSEIETKFAGEEETTPPEEEPQPETDETPEETSTEEQAEEEIPETTGEPDEFEAMSRDELKRYIVKNKVASLLTDEGKLNIKKSETDDEIRNKIREALASQGEEEGEETEPEPEPEEEPQGDEFDAMSRDDLKRYIVKNKVASLLTDEGKLKVRKSDTDDELRDKIRSAIAEKKPKGKPVAKGSKECPAGGTFGRDADQHEECLECKLYKECSAESER